MSMSKTFIGGAICREFKLEALVAEEILDRHVQQRTVLESGDGSGTFCNFRQSAPDSWCHDVKCLGL